MNGSIFESFYKVCKVLYLHVGWVDHIYKEFSQLVIVNYWGPAYGPQWNIIFYSFQRLHMCVSLLLCLVSCQYIIYCKIIIIQDLWQLPLFSHSDSLTWYSYHPQLCKLIFSIIPTITIIELSAGSIIIISALFYRVFIATFSLSFHLYSKLVQLLL